VLSREVLQNYICNHLFPLTAFPQGGLSLAQLDPELPSVVEMGRNEQSRPQLQPPQSSTQEQELVPQSVVKLGTNEQSRPQLQLLQSPPSPAQEPETQVLALPSKP